MYVEAERRKGKEYHYLVENVRSNGGWKKIKVYLGSSMNGKQLEEAVSRKRELLVAKTDAFMKASDRLLTIITPTEEVALDHARKTHSKALRCLGKHMLGEYYKDFAVSFTYNTNAIEGSTLSLLDTKLLLDDRVTPHGKTVKEMKETLNHNGAFWHMLSYNGSLTRQFVLKLHKLLMHDILWKQAGKFRDVHVRLIGVDKLLPPPERVPVKFKEATLWYARNRRKYHPLVVAAFFHHAFESVHPFRDGNGRVGRLLMNYMLKRSGYPMIDIKHADRRRYYDALQSGDRGDFRPLVEMMMGYVLEEAKLIAPSVRLPRKARATSVRGG